MIKNTSSIFFNWSLAFILIIITLTCGDPAQDGFMHVSMMDNFFSPPLARIPEGGEIQYINKGLNPHNAIAVDKSWSTETTFGNLTMLSGDKTKVSYPEQGVFPYYCSFHATPDGSAGMVGNVVVGDVEFKPTAAGKNWKVTQKWSGTTRRVPGTYPTIQNAVDAAVPGDLILIDAGIYKEEVIVTTPSLIIRGVDRNTVIIDGEFVRGNGIIVVGADGVAIENMTARNATLNGFFWTGVKGYRGSYLTAINNGDYGLYAFDSIDGMFEYSYGSGSPDSSYYVGQCYPCNVILHNLIGQNSALGYSGTNSGGNLYIINSVFENNIVGLAPNTLDSELLPPERESTIWGNIVINNNNPGAPFKPLTWPTFGNGIIIAGGIHNNVEKNLISGHPNHGILILPNLQDNLWLSYNNTIKDNIVLNSGRADISQVGPVSHGNCFSGNSFSTSIPFGLQIGNHCNSPIRMILGGELSMLFGGLAMMFEAKMGLVTPGDYKTQPHPGPQIQMPENLKKQILPAVNVFEKNKHMIKTPAYHPELKKYRDSIQSRHVALTGSIKPLIPNSASTIFFHVFGYLLPFVIFSCWTCMAFWDMHLGGEIKFSRLLIVAGLPFVGSLIYHILWANNIPKWLRISMLTSGSGAWFIFLIAVIMAIL